MKYRPEIYARALTALAQNQPQKIAEYFRNFMIVLRRNGDLPALKKITARVEALVIRAHGGRKIIFESARELPAEQLKQLTQKFSSRDVIEAKINPDLIAGVRIKIDGEAIVDATLKRKLKKLFEI